jgi:O-antigen/teichoic acid export membrane protein
MTLVRHLESRFKLMTFVGALMPTVSALAVQLVAFAVTARGLGVEAFGSYTAILAVTIVSVELVGFGGADLLVRAVSREPNKFASYFGNLLLLAAITLPVVVAGGVAVSVGFMQTQIDTWHVLAIIVGEVTLNRIAASVELIMVAHRHTVRAGWIRLTTAALRMFLALGFFLVFGLNDLNGWIELAFVQCALTAAVYLGLVIALYGRPHFVLKRQEWKAGGAFCVNQAARASQGNFDRIILGRFADAASVGIYGAASRVLALGLFPLQVVTRITYPNFFVHGKSGLAASRGYALKITPMLFGVGIASSIAVAAAGYLAPFALGKDFASMANISAMLGLALPLIALQYPPADALTGAGKQGIRAFISLCATFGFGLLMALGVKIAGISGLVAAFLASHACLAAAMWLAAFLVQDKATVEFVATAEETAA